MLVLADSFMGYMAVQRPLAVESWGDLFVHTKYIPAERAGPGRQFAPVEEAKYPLQSILDRYRDVIVEKGGVPEAVRLLDPFLRFNVMEKLQMAEKLSKKTAAPKADAKGKGAAADKPKAKGNPEALAKAREAGAASREAARARKIKALIKPKEIAAREGSFRHQMLTDLLAAKTVGEFYDAGEKYDAGCLRYAVENNIVSVG